MFSCNINISILGLGQDASDKRHRKRQELRRRLSTVPSWVTTPMGFSSRL